MSSQRRYEALMEEWPGDARLYIRDLPGFFASARDRDDLIERSLDALDLHLAWLDLHGYAPAEEREGGLVIIEDLPSRGEIGPRFDADLLELGGDEIENALSLGRIALSDVIDLADELSTDPKRSDEIGRMILHIAVKDLWFATRMIERAPSLKPTADPIDAMIAAAGIFEERADEIASGDPDEIVERDGEEWTLAKILRRRTAHIREHALELAELAPSE